MKIFLSILAFVTFLIVLASVAKASHPINVTLYCQAPNAACDVSVSHLETLGIPFQVVRGWTNDEAYNDLEMVASYFGIRNTTLPFFKIENSIVVGLTRFDEVYQTIQNNRR